MAKKKKVLYSVLKPVTHRITGETILPGGEIDLGHVNDPQDLAWMFERGLIERSKPYTVPVIDDAIGDMYEEKIEEA